MNKIAIAGSTGYLGKYLVGQLIEQNISGVVLTRNLEKLTGFRDKNITIKKVELTQAKTLEGALDGVAMASDMTAPKYGEQKIKDFYATLILKNE